MGGSPPSPPVPPSRSNCTHPYGPLLNRLMNKSSCQDSLLGPPPPPLALWWIFQGPRMSRVLVRLLLIHLFFSVQNHPMVWFILLVICLLVNLVTMFVSFFKLDRIKTCIGRTLRRFIGKSYRYSNKRKSWSMLSIYRIVILKTSYFLIFIKNKYSRENRKR